MEGKTMGQVEQRARGREGDVVRKGGMVEDGVWSEGWGPQP